MRVLGYNGGLDGYPSKFGSSHDAAASLVIDGELVAACEEERFSRDKHSGAFPRAAIEYCLQVAGLRSVDQLDLICSYYSYPLMWNPRKYSHNKQGMNLLTQGLFWGGLSALRAYNRAAKYEDDRSRVAFERRMGTSIRESQYAVVPHHVCHTASTYYDSPFSSALCLTLDAEGESASSMVIRARDTKLDVLRETYSPNSLGYLYTFITTFLGFDYWDEYKVMGLAPYGDPSAYRSYFESIIRLLPDGKYEVNQGLILYLITRDWWFRRGGGGFPRSMTNALGPERRSSDPVTQRHMDIAAALQEALERTVLHVLAHFQKATGETNLCMAGGVALNCSMNGKIARSGLFENIWIHPAAHDSGTSAGAAMYGYHNILKQPRKISTRKNFYLGPGYESNDIDQAVRDFGAKIAHRKPKQLYRDVAQAIADGKVVGWYQDRMEWGPRALGNRSILADARRDDMKDIVNHAVKLREGFRPFAPACLAERAADWFDLTGLSSSPYMLFVVPVKYDKRGRIPAVTHVDGSARVQTVTAEDNEKFHGLLQAFYEITGVPLVLNTSFNVKGEPIVNTPADAIRCFLNTQIDILVLGDVMIEKRPEVATALAADRAKNGSAGRVVNGQISAL